MVIKGAGAGELESLVEFVVEGKFEVGPADVEAEFDECAETGSLGPEVGGALAEGEAEGGVVAREAVEVGVAKEGEGECGVSSEAPDGVAIVVGVENGEFLPCGGEFAVEGVQAGSVGEVAGPSCSGDEGYKEGQ